MYRGRYLLCLRLLRILSWPHRYSLYPIVIHRTRTISMVLFEASLLAEFVTSITIISSDHASMLVRRRDPYSVLHMRPDETFQFVARSSNCLKPSFGSGS
ncbi:hypothetical protein FB446DRAFT_293950 [Lentinula raphanica]|nr:hypothetical protein FB446DRAFT_293950 [Lentinula raphanica]